MANAAWDELSSSVERFWSTVTDRAASNEATVETWFVLPLLEALGHDSLHIDAKPSVTFQEGRKGRKPEADFVVYAEATFSRATSLIAVEAKGPAVPLADGKAQGESYAQNLRAPVLLLTNSIDLEIWQLQQTTESTLVLSCAVVDLARHRGTLESLLSPAALRAHCADLEHKRFELHLRDLGAYERVAHDHAMELARASIPRRLTGGPEGMPMSSGNLLDLEGRGAVITGASGDGKTVLGGMLLAEAVERRRAGQGGALPIHLFAPDLALSGKTLLQFLAERIAAHKPGFTEARLREVASVDGLIVIVDGFERVAREERGALEAGLRVLLQDQPRTRLYLMSRAGCAPTDISVPTLALQPYEPEDLRALADRRGDGHAFSSAPDFVTRLAATPLLADLILKRRARDGTDPTDLTSLFDDWLGRILAGLPPVDAAVDRDLLAAIAEATHEGAIAVARCRTLVEAGPDPDGALTRLIERDALSVQGSAFELRHEALADHLRALRFWAAHPQANDATLDALSFDAGSLFATLIVANAPEARARGAAWEAVARQDLLAAIRTLRFSGYDLPFEQTIDVGAALGMAEGLGQAAETVVSTHLAPIAPLLRDRIAGQPVARLGVSASVDQWGIAYRFFDAAGADAAARVVAGAQDEGAPRTYGHALHQMGFGPGAGRLLGMQRVRSALKEAVKARDLPGGRVWREERSIGRLRCLRDQYNTPVDPHRFSTALTHLEPHANESVGGDPGGQNFSISSLLSDLRWLADRGINRIEPWWIDLDRLDLDDSTDQDRAAQALNAYYCRLQIAYDEVADHAFPALRPYLRKLRSMPLRMELILEVHDRRGYLDATLHQVPWPTRDYSTAGADMTFGAPPSAAFDKDFSDHLVQRTGELLRKFGRYHPDYGVYWGNGRLPDLGGGGRDHGLQPHESAVVAGAMRWLSEDLETLFSEMP